MGRSCCNKISFTGEIKDGDPSEQRLAVWSDCGGVRSVLPCVCVHVWVWSCVCACSGWWLTHLFWSWWRSLASSLIPYILSLHGLCTSFFVRQLLFCSLFVLFNMPLFPYVLIHHVVSPGHLSTRSAAQRSVGSSLLWLVTFPGRDGQWEVLAWQS